ncbi:tyrosine--tRNA ligase [archaeon]|jgi:tyrosyl-tRNA synthetase|nr:tyrosine--tRNA ligase [archaeon]
MAEKMNSKDRLDLITRNIAEIIGKDDLEKKIKSGKDISLYWGTMPTGSISIAYFFPMMKIADFLKAGIKVKILLADLHAALDSVPWEELEKRTAYYKKAIVTMLETIGVPVDNLQFVQGKDIQVDTDYYMDLLKLSTIASIHDSKKAASEVVKLGDNPKLSGVIYPLMQALDEEYLGVDIQFGGLDQRKIMVFARENLPKIGYKQRIEIMNPLIRGLVGEKMSSSIKSTKIDLMDDESVVKKRINKADCVAGNPDNGLMALAQYLIFGVKDKFVIERPDKYGGNLEFNNYKELKVAFEAEKLHPMDLKAGVASELNELLSNFRDNAELTKLHKAAYPQD